MTDNMEEASQTEQNIEIIRDAVLEDQGFTTYEEMIEINQLSKILDNADTQLN